MREKKVEVKNGIVLNILDKYFDSYLAHPYTFASSLSSGDLGEISTLTPVNLLELELRNDYAVGFTADKKSIFKRIISLTLSGLSFLTSNTGCAGTAAPGTPQQSALTREVARAGTEAPDAPAYAFARKYTVSEIMRDPQRAEAFINEYLGQEAEYYKIARRRGIAIDGWDIDPNTLKPIKAREHTAASKECLDLAVQTKIITGNRYAIRLTGTTDARLAKQKALGILSEKIDSYEQFNRDFPAFGGFLPWIKVNTRVEPTSDWSDRVPALDNGEWVWSLYATYHSLQNIGETELANRYKKYFDMLARNAPEIFYDKTLRKVRAETKIQNPNARSVASGNYSNNVPGYYLDDPYEGLMMVHFLTLFTNLPRSEKDHIWKDIEMEKVTTSWGTTYKGWPPQSPLDGSPHIKWAFMFLPMTDNPIAMKVYLLQEKIRSNMHKYGIPVSTNTPGAIGYTAYAPNVFGVYGPFSMIFGQTLQGDVTVKNYGLAWLLNVLKADKMQGPLGSGELVSVKPGTNQLEEISPMLTVDGKMILWMAMMGGITNETRAALEQDGVYDEFMERVNQQYAETFGSLSSVTDNTQFRLPQGPIVGTYAPKVHEQTTKTTDLATFWQYPSTDKQGDKTAVRLEGNKMIIEYKPGSTGGWGWAGGSLKGALVPTENSAIYFKGTGRFTLKLEGTPQSGAPALIPVELKGENTWVKVPLQSVAGKAFFVIVIDNIMDDVVITGRVYSPDGNVPGQKTSLIPARVPASSKSQKSAKSAVSPQKTTTTGTNLLARYNLSASSNWRQAAVSKSGGSLIVRHNESANGYGWSWAGENLREPYTLKAGERIRVQGKGKFTLKLEGSETVSREVNLDKNGSAILDFPAGLKIQRMVIDKVMYKTSVTIEKIEVIKAKETASTAFPIPEELAIVLIGGQITRMDEVNRILWDYVLDYITSQDAKVKLAAVAPIPGATPEETDEVYAAVLAQARTTMLTLAARRSPTNEKPTDEEIRALAARIKELDIELFMPQSQLSYEKQSSFRRTIETIFGDRLRAYQDIDHLTSMIKNPQKSIVMTIDLTNSQVDQLENIKETLNQARFMNFKNMDINAMSTVEYENYFADIVGILLTARTITAEEAADKGSRAYRMLAHLLEDRIEVPKEMDTYIRTIADNTMDSIAKLRYLLKNILKALPVEAYKIIRPAIQVLWSA